MIVTYIEKRPFLSSLLIFSFLFFLNTPRYESNDDLGIVYWLHETIEPLFISPILSFFFHILYTQVNFLPIWSLFLYLCQFCGLILFLKYLMPNIINIQSKIFFLVALLSLYSYIFWCLNFLSTCLFVTGSICFLFTSNIISQRQKTYKTIHIFLLGFFFSIVYLIRPSDFLISLILFSPVLILLLIKRNWKIIITFLIPLIFIICISIVLNETYQTSEYQEYQPYRGQFTDYDIIKTKNYNQTLHLLNINENDIIIFKNWWFFDYDLFSLNNLKILISNAMVPSRLTFSHIRLISSLFDYRWFFLIMIFCIIGQCIEIFYSDLKNYSRIFKLQIEKEDIQLEKIIKKISINSFLPFSLLLPGILLELLILGTRPVPRVVIPILLYIVILIMLIMDNLKSYPSYRINYHDN